MGKIVVKKAVERKPGYLYYVDGKGNVCESKMARGKKKKTAKEKTCEKEKINSLNKIIFIFLFKLKTKTKMETLKKQLKGGITE